MIKAMKRSKYIHIEFKDPSQGAPVGLTVGGRVPYEVAISIQNHFNNLGRQ